MNELNNYKVLDLIYNSIKSEGGDGHAIWLSKFVSIENLISLIDKYNYDNDTNWDILKGDGYLTWGENQEWATITNDKKFFSSRPDWIELKINY